MCMRVIRAVTCRSIKEEASLVERPEAVLTFLGGRYIVRQFGGVPLRLVTWCR